MPERSTPGAAVSISGPAQRTCITNEKGECAFAGLLSGQYQVKTELAGFRTMVHIIEVTPSRTERVNVVLRVGGLEETVTVTGSAPVVDTRSAARAMPAPPPAPMSPGMPAIVGGNTAGYTGGIAAEPYYRRPERGNTEAYDKIDDNPFRSVVRESALDVLDRRRHRVVRERAAVPERRPAAAGGRGAHRGADQLLPLRLPAAARRSAVRGHDRARRLPVESASIASRSIGLQGRAIDARRTCRRATWCS